MPRLPAPKGLLRAQENQLLKSYAARGIVLHTLKYGERSCVAWILTDTHGRQSYMVYRRQPLLQPLFLVELEAGVSSRAEMHRLREVHAAVPLTSIPFDVRKSTVALFVAELLYRLVCEVEPNSPLFEFVWDAVTRLDQTQQGVANFHLDFLVGLCRHLGFAPQGEWSPGGWFDIREGSFTPVRPHGDCFEPENAALLAAFLSGEEPALNRGRRVDFLGAMLAYLGYHLDAVRDIRSVEILREVF